MKRARVEFARPHVARDFEFISEGPDGTVWQAADSMSVRVAAVERRRGAAGKAEALDLPPAGHELASGRAVAW